MSCGRRPSVPWLSRPRVSSPSSAAGCSHAKPGRWPERPRSRVPHPSPPAMSCVSYRLLSRTGNRRIVTPTPALLHVRIGPPPACGNETVDPGLQHRQRHRAELQHRIVKGAHVEALAERLLRARTGVEKRALAQVVRQRLSRPGAVVLPGRARSEEHTSELQSRRDLVCRLLLEKKKKNKGKHKI